MTFSPAPKNVGRLDQDERLAAKVQRLIERKRNRKPLKRSWIARGTKPIQKVNVERTKRRHAKYRKVLASPFHKQLRYRAWLRSGGRCECEVCHEARQPFSASTVAERERAWAEIPVWFEKGGGQPWKRFRCDAGECHHTSYSRFGQESDAELHLVRFVWVECHRRIEAEHGTRRRFLRSGK